MKKICFLLWMLTACITSIFAQTPEAINYQAVARDNNGNLIANQEIRLRVSILRGSASGTVVYSESHLKTTNDFGLATLSIGTGTVISGSFPSIRWGDDAYYLQTEMDPAGGTDFQLMGTSQFVSVPFALYAKTAASGGTTYTEGSGIDITGAVITNTSPNASHTGDATGASALTVVKMQGRDVSSSAPANGDVLKWNNGNARWEPSAENNAVSQIVDADNDTKVMVEKITDEDIIHFDLGGTERWIMSGARLEPRNSGNSLFIGQEAGLSDNLSLHYNTYIGNYSGNSSTTGTRNTGIGYRSMTGTTTGSDLVAVGYYAAGTNQGFGRITAVGSNALGWANNSSENSFAYNTAVGYSALKGSFPVSVNTGTGNTAVGDMALFPTSAGSNNTAIGRDAGTSNTTGSNNLYLGCKAGDAVTTGSGNIIIGYDIDPPSATGSDQLVIGAANLLFGDIINKRIGIGTTSLSQKFEVKDGNILLSNSSAASELRFAEPSASGSNYTAFKAQAQSADITYTWPPTIGSWGQVLILTTAGKLAWTSTPSVSALMDTDEDTQITLEAGMDEDRIRFDLGGDERWVMTGTRIEAKNLTHSVIIGDSAGYNDPSYDYALNSTFIGYRSGRNNGAAFRNTDWAPIPSIPTHPGITIQQLVIWPCIRISMEMITRLSGSFH